MLYANIPDVQEDSAIIQAYKRIFESYPLGKTQEEVAVLVLEGVSAAGSGFSDEEKLKILSEIREVEYSTAKRRREVVETAEELLFWKR